jgi:hypothetical protein
VKPLRLLAILIVTAACIVPLQDALAREPCSGHQLLKTPRPETSCLDVAPKVFVSPDKEVRAIVLPVDVSLYATPDMESRVVIRTRSGDTITAKDYSSPRGMNGLYVVEAKWSPDSQFFVYSMSSSGGHSPWSYPIMVFSRQQKRIAAFSDMIAGKPTLSANFNFTGPHTLDALHVEGSGKPGRQGAGVGESRRGVREDAAVLGLTGARRHLVPPSEPSEKGEGLRGKAQ